MASTSASARPALALAARQGGRSFKSFHTSPSRLAGGKTKIKSKKGGSERDLRKQIFDMRSDMPVFLGQDVPTTQHLQWSDARRRLEGLRMIEYQMPGLTQFRQPFVPPPADASVAVRTRDNMFGNPHQHPTDAKDHIVTISVPLSSIPALASDPAKMHKAKVVAGNRWHPPHPSNNSRADEHGTVVIESSQYPTRSQNERFASDCLDNLLAAASDLTDSYADMPPQPYIATKPRFPNARFPDEWLAPNVREEVEASRKRAAEKRAAIKAAQDEEADRLRKRYGWDGVGLAPVGAFESKEERARGEAQKVLLQQLEESARHSPRSRRADV